MITNLAVVYSLIYRQHLIPSTIRCSWINLSIMESEEHHYNGSHLIYLTESTFVHVNGSNSTLLDVTCGVPQGSVLGLLPFLVYINDLPHTSSKLVFYLFADDTNIYCESGDLTVKKLLTRN